MTSKMGYSFHLCTRLGNFSYKSYMWNCIRF